MLREPKTEQETRDGGTSHARSEMKQVHRFGEKDMTVRAIHERKQIEQKGMTMVDERINRKANRVKEGVGEDV